LAGWVVVGGLGGGWLLGGRADGTGITAAAGCGQYGDGPEHNG